MVKVIDRYVFLRSLKYFLLSYIVFLSLFMLVEYMGHLDRFLEAQNLKFGFIYVLSRVPLYTVRILPISMLISSLVTVSDFSSTYELTVLKSLGISFYRFSAPILFLSLLVFAFSVFVDEAFVPKGVKVSREMYSRMGGKPFSFTIEGSVWFKKGKRTFVKMDRVDVKEGKGERVSIIKLDENLSPVERIDALEASYAGGTNWNLEGVIIRDLKRKVFKKERAMKLDLGISISDLIFYRVDPETESFLSLLRSIRHLRSMGYNVDRFFVDLYNKVSIPLIVIVAALFGIPLGSYNPKNRKGYTVLVAAGSIVLLWFTISIFNALGRNGILPPFYASFSPEVTFASLALILFSRVHT